MTVFGKVEAGVLEPDVATRAAADPAASPTDLAVEARYLYATVRGEDLEVSGLAVRALFTQAETDYDPHTRLDQVTT